MDCNQCSHCFVSRWVYLDMESAMDPNRNPEHVRICIDCNIIDGVVQATHSHQHRFCLPAGGVGDVKVVACDYPGCRAKMFVVPVPILNDFSKVPIIWSPLGN